MTAALLVPVRAELANWPGWVAHNSDRTIVPRGQEPAKCRTRCRQRQGPHKVPRSGPRGSVQPTARRLRHIVRQPLRRQTWPKRTIRRTPAQSQCPTRRGVPEQERQYPSSLYTHAAQSWSLKQSGWWRVASNGRTERRKGGEQIFPLPDATRHVIAFPLLRP